MDFFFSNRRCSDFETNQRFLRTSRNTPLRDTERLNRLINCWDDSPFLNSTVVNGTSWLTGTHVPVHFWTYPEIRIGS